MSFSYKIPLGGVNMPKNILTFVILIEIKKKGPVFPILAVFYGIFQIWYQILNSHKGKVAVWWPIGKSLKQIVLTKNHVS
jgi:hypothetical protein